MTSEKKSFVLYFDMYPQLQKLSPEQRGELMSALFECALQESLESGTGRSAVQGHPTLTPETLMAFDFISETILRDTEKWRQKHLRYQKAALDRHQKQREQTQEDEMAKYQRNDYPSRSGHGRKEWDDIWNYV